MSDIQEKYDKLYDAAKRLSLSNIDLSILLQTTPVMVSRYRHNATRMGTRGDPEKLKRAAKSLKLVRKAGVSNLRQMTPQERAATCVNAVREADPELQEVKAPLIM